MPETEMALCMPVTAASRKRYVSCSTSYIQRRSRSNEFCLLAWPNWCGKYKDTILGLQLRLTPLIAVMKTYGGVHCCKNGVLQDLIGRSSGLRPLLLCVAKYEHSYSAHQLLVTAL